MVCVCLKSICLLSMCVFVWGGFGRLLEGYGWACLYVCLKGYVLMGLRHDDAVLLGRKGKWWEKVDFTLPGKLRFHLEASRRGYISAIGNCLCHELGLLCVCVCVCVSHTHTCMYIHIWILYGWLFYTSLCNLSYPSYPILVCPHQLSLGSSCGISKHFQLNSAMKEIE